MDLSQIKQLIDAMTSSDLAEMSFSHQGWVLRLVRHPSAGQRGDDAARLPERVPPVPTLAHDQPAPPARPVSLRRSGANCWPRCSGSCTCSRHRARRFVQPGQAVQAGQTVCVIEAMKVFNAVVAESDGTVAAVLVESGAEVEAGQPLIRFA